MNPVSASARPRTATRLTIVGALAGLLLGAFALAVPSAQAAWTNGAQAHGGKVQVCKVILGGGDYRVKVRLDNRGARHTHTGALTRSRGSKLLANLSLRAGAGTMSKTKSLVWTRAQRNRGETLSVGFGEAAGIGMGGDVYLSQTSVC